MAWLVMSIHDLNLATHLYRIAQEALTNGSPMLPERLSMNLKSG
jgi:hypothetical protein